MNKSQIVEKIAKDTGLPKAQALKALDSFTSTVSKEVQKGRKVTLTGFGTFDRAVRKTRIARNPQTGEQIKIPRTKYPRFKAGATFKGAVKGKKS